MIQVGTMLNVIDNSGETMNNVNVVIGITNQIG